MVSIMASVELQTGPDPTNIPQASLNVVWFTSNKHHHASSSVMQSCDLKVHRGYGASST